MTLGGRQHPHLRQERNWKKEEGREERSERERERFVCDTEETPLSFVPRGGRREGMQPRKLVSGGGGQSTDSTEPSRLLQRCSSAQLAG